MNERTILDELFANYLQNRDEILAACKDTPDGRGAMAQIQRHFHGTTEERASAKTWLDDIRAVDRAVDDVASFHGILLGAAVTIDLPAITRDIARSSR